LPVVGRAQALPPEPVYRYLFVVDLSRAMAPQADSVRRAIFDCVAGGFDGQILPGDRFGIWTYNETANTHHFPPLAWQTRAAQEYAEAAFRFLNAQRWQGTARPDPVLDEIFSAIRGSPALTVFLFSAGAVSLKDAPFGDSLDAFYKQVAAEAQRTRKPFLTTLVAQRGDVVHAEVGFADGPLQVPKTGSPARAPAPSAASTTASPPVASADSPAAATPFRELPAKLSPKAPIVLVAPAVPAATAAEKPLLTVPSLDSLMAEAQSDAAVAAPSEAPQRARLQPGPGAEPPSSKPGSPNPLAEFSPASVLPGNESAAGFPASAPIQPVVVFAPPGFLASRASLLVVGAILFGLSIVLAWLLTRAQRSARSPSLISQSIDRDPG
jgi:hypothetical protein